METKVLLTGIISFIAGGLLVSTAAVTIEKPQTAGQHANMSLQGKTGDDFDKAFITGMIAHHQDAISMAQLAHENAARDEIKKLSKEIITAQESEIKQMQQWQHEWGYVPHETIQPADH